MAFSLFTFQFYCATHACVCIYNLMDFIFLSKHFLSYRPGSTNNSIPFLSRFFFWVYRKHFWYQTRCYSVWISLIKKIMIKKIISYSHESPFYLSQKTFSCARLMMMLITTAEFLWKKWFFLWSFRIYTWKIDCFHQDNVLYFC